MEKNCVNDNLLALPYFCLRPFFQTPLLMLNQIFDKCFKMSKKQQGSQLKLKNWSQMEKFWTLHTNCRSRNCSFSIIFDKSWQHCKQEIGGVPKLLTRIKCRNKCHKRSSITPRSSKIVNMNAKFGSDHFFTPLQKGISCTYFPTTGSSPWVWSKRGWRLDMRVTNMFSIFFNLKSNKKFVKILSNFLHNENGKISWKGVRNWNVCILGVGFDWHWQVLFMVIAKGKTNVTWQDNNVKHARAYVIVDFWSHF